MAIKMKALKTFQLSSSGPRAKVRMGREFDAATEDYASYLEKNSMATRLSPKQARPARGAARAANPASEAGPLSSAGGRTGATKSASSSGRGRQRAK